MCPLTLTNKHAFTYNYMDLIIWPKSQSYRQHLRCGFIDAHCYIFRASNFQRKRSVIPFSLSCFFVNIGAFCNFLDSSIKTLKHNQQFISIIPILQKGHFEKWQSLTHKIEHQVFLSKLCRKQWHGKEKRVFIKIFEFG